jgi:3-oxoacyl-[acyl-carrier protein] reductase
MQLDGKIAIVIGGGSGFGEGIVRGFVAAGARVIVADRDGASAERVAASVGPAAHAVTVDVARDADAQAMVQAAYDNFGDLHILVNNAGIGHVPQPLDGLAEDMFDRILAVNVKAIYLAARHVVPRFKAKKSGVILNVASTGGVSPRPNLT